MTLRLAVRLRRGACTLAVEAEVPMGGITVVLGPSGSGKTTLLRVVAGLEDGPEVRLAWRGRVWHSPTERLPVHHRPVALIWQQPILLPHLDVAGNLAFAAQRAVGLPPWRRDELVALLRLEPLLPRRPASLSGGEQQRVAIAQALLRGPELLLADEPLSAIDPAHREELVTFFAETARRGMPILYVTHRLSEAARLADRILYLEAGRLRAVGSPSAVFTDPELPLLHLPDACGVLEVTVAAPPDADGLTELRTHANDPIFLPSEAPVGSRVRVRILARDVGLALSPPQASSILNRLPVVVERLVESSGAYAVAILDYQGVPLLARLTRRSAERLGLAPGRRLYALIKSAALL